MFKGFEKPEEFESFLLNYAKQIVQRIEESGYSFVGDSVYWQTFVIAIDDVYFSNKEVIEFYGSNVLYDAVKQQFYEDTFMPLSRLVLSLLVSQKLVDKQLFTKEQAQLYVDATMSLWYQDNGQSAKLPCIRGNFERRERFHLDEDEAVIQKKYFVRKMKQLFELQKSFGGDTEAMGLAEREIKVLWSGFVLWRLFQDYRGQGKYEPSTIATIKHCLFGNRHVSLGETFQLESESKVLEELLAIDILMKDVVTLRSPAKYLFSHALTHQFMQISVIPMNIGIDLYNDEEVKKLDAYDGYVEKAVNQIRAELSNC